MNIKCGTGFDAHKFEPGRPLIIGGIEISYEKGLAGHSDADVLIHAIIDAIAGPSLGKDIGGLFPDTDEKYKNIDSKILLARTIEQMKEKGWKLGNVDAQIIAQEPKMATHIPKMRHIIAAIFSTDEENVTIKATTTEKMGFTGRKEGIAAMATALIVKE